MSNHTTEAELRGLTDQGLSFKEIGELLGIPRSMIAVSCSVLEIRSGARAENGRQKKEYPIDQYLSMLASGMSVAEMAVELGLPKATLYARLKHRGLPTSSREYLKRQHKATS